MYAVRLLDYEFKESPQNNKDELGLQELTTTHTQSTSTDSRQGSAQCSWSNLKVRLGWLEDDKTTQDNMATNVMPGWAGGDLPEPQQTAFLQGHDADIPTDSATPVQANETDNDLEKSNLQSKNTSLYSNNNASNNITQGVDPNTVDWASPSDPANPRNWSATHKWLQIAVLVLLSFLTPLASSMLAPGVPELMREFETDSSSLSTLVVSIYVLGFAFGPLVFAPLSELYGRMWIYHICNIGFVSFTIASGRAQSIGELCVYRFLQGLWGVCPLTIGGGTIADLMAPETRGTAMAIWAIGPVLGPVVGPVCGGFLSEATSWRWINYVVAMIAAACAVAAFFILRETFAPVLLERKAAKLRKETGNQNLRSKLDNGQTPKEMFLLAIVRPTKMLFLSPICGFMSLYIAIVYGFLYLLFTTFTFVFEDSYGFTPSYVGLVYLGIGGGNIIGLILIGGTFDRIGIYLSKKKGGGIKPEYRLPPLIMAGPLIPIGLFTYGFTAQHQIQWAVPLFGTLLMGVGVIATFMSVNTYLVDAFNIYAASALAASTVLRSIFGCVFPLFGLQMYDALGLGWGNALLAFVAMTICPIPYIFFKYGEKIRTHPRWQMRF